MPIYTHSYSAFGLSLLFLKEQQSEFCTVELEAVVVGHQYHHARFTVDQGFHPHLVRDTNAPDQIEELHAPPLALKLFLSLHMPVG
jgi:hypothetical protein